MRYIWISLALLAGVLGMTNSASARGPRVIVAPAPVFYSPVVPVVRPVYPVYYSPVVPVVRPVYPAYYGPVVPVAPVVPYGYGYPGFGSAFDFGFTVIR